LFLPFRGFLLSLRLRYRWFLDFYPYDEEDELDDDDDDDDDELLEDYDEFNLLDLYYSVLLLLSFRSLFSPFFSFALSSILKPFFLSESLCFSSFFLGLNDAKEPSPKLLLLLLLLLSLSEFDLLLFLVLFYHKGPFFFFSDFYIKIT
jgi:hypothetical protein